MTRKKLPAYGATLLKARRSGTHPLCVHLIYGNNWRSEECKWCCEWPDLEGVHPILALKPDDYEPGVYDFSVVTGVNVALFDQVDAAGEYKFEQGRYSEFGKFWSLAGELAQFSAGVDAYSTAFGASPWRIDISAAVARDHVLSNDPSHNHGWPRWWSEEIEKKHEQRRLTWLTNVDQYLARRFAECA